MTSQPRLLKTNTPVALASLGHAANTYCPAHPILRLATAKTQAVDRAPTLSNDRRDADLCPRRGQRGVFRHGGEAIEPKTQNQKTRPVRAGLAAGFGGTTESLLT